MFYRVVTLSCYETGESSQRHYSDVEQNNSGVSQYFYLKYHYDNDNIFIYGFLQVVFVVILRMK